MKLNVDGYLNSEWEKYCEEQGCDLTEDDLTLLGEHTRKMEEAKKRGAIFDHALTKAFAYAESGKNTKLIKDGVMLDAYLDGFLDGVAFRMGGGHD